MSKYKIGIFKDKEDIMFEITDDNIINITGMMGSGKTTLAKKMCYAKKLELVLLDWMFGFSVANRPQEISDLLKEIEKTYPETKEQQIFQISNNHKRTESYYFKYTNIMYQYLLDTIEEPTIIEGRHIYEYMNPELLKGKIIIKRTSLINSYIRAFKRDVSRLYNRYKFGYSTKKDVLNKILERLKFPIKDYIKINNFITKLVNLLN